MAQSPQHPDQSRAPYAALPAHNRGDGDHVIRVGGMAHAQEKSQRDNREQSDHLVTPIAASAAPYTGRSAARGILTAVLRPCETKSGEWISNVLLGRANRTEQCREPQYYGKRGLQRGRADGVLCRLYP